MPKNTRLVFPLLGCLIIAMLSVSACEISTPTPLPTCDAGETPLYRISYPGLFSVIDDLRPTITWASEDAICMPARFDIQIFSAKNYLPGASAGYLVMAGSSTTDQFVWPSDADSLEPGNTYLIAFEYPTMLDGEEAGYSSQWSYFSTGPICAAGEEVLAPSLRWPPDGWNVDPASIEMEWDNEMACWPSDNFYIEVSKWRDFRNPIIQTQYNQGEIFWPRRDTPWENCATYFWHVRSNMEGMEAEPWSETWSFVIQPGDMLCPIEIPIITPIPIPILITLVEANCRSGPTLDYPLLSLLPAGQQYEIGGTNQQGDSWLIFDPAIQNSCWVFGELGEVSGDTSQVPIIQVEPPPPTPTATSASVDCSQYNTNPQACDANPACWWDSSVPPNGVCKNK